MELNRFRKQFAAVEDAWALAQAIVDTVREPVLVLDKDLRVIAASRSFYSSFKVWPQDTQGKLLYELGDGQWDITVGYDAVGMNWKLSVADDGIGRPDGVFAQPKSGLGTSIVKALAQQLGAQVETVAGTKGTSVSVTHATFLAKTRAA